MGNRRCFECSKLTTCKFLDELKDENGRVMIQALNFLAINCKDYSNLKEDKSYGEV